MEQSNTSSSCDESKSNDVPNVSIEGTLRGDFEDPPALVATREISEVTGSNIDNGKAPHWNMDTEDKIPTAILRMDVFVNYVGNNKKNLAAPALNVNVKVSQSTCQSDMNSIHFASGNVEEAPQTEVHASERDGGEKLHCLEALKAQRSNILEKYEKFGWCYFFDYNNGVKAEDIFDKLIADPNAHVDPAIDLGMNRTSLHWAVMLDLPPIVSKIVEIGKVDVNSVTYSQNRTALHYAVQVGNINIVTELLKSKTVRLAEETVLGETPVQLAFQMGKKDIEKMLLEQNAVKAYVETLYRDQQAYVDAANAILVGAALIASVTFASWLQPPMGYIPYYGESFVNTSPGPSIINPSFADFQHHKELRAFWVFNSLAFYFAIGTVVSGARSVSPRWKTFIKRVVERTRINLWVTTILLICSVFFVITAFGIAGCIVLPPILDYEAYMIGTSVLGGLLCLISLILLLKRIWIERPRDNYPKSEFIVPQ